MMPAITQYTANCYHSVSQREMRHTDTVKRVNYTLALSSVLTRQESAVSSDSTRTDQSPHTHCSAHVCRLLTLDSRHICTFT